MRTVGDEAIASIWPDPVLARILMAFASPPSSSLPSPPLFLSHSSIIIIATLLSSCWFH